MTDRIRGRRQEGGEKRRERVCVHGEKRREEEEESVWGEGHLPQSGQTRECSAIGRERTGGETVENTEMAEPKGKKANLRRVAHYARPRWSSPDCGLQYGTVFYSISHEPEVSQASLYKNQDPMIEYSGRIV